MTNERLCTLTDLNGKARSLARAAAELMQADSSFSTSDLHTNDQQKQLELWDLLRLHDTCGSLLFSLIDIFDRVDGQLDAEDAGRTAAGATTEKPDGIPGTETTPRKIAQMRGNRDFVGVCCMKLNESRLAVAAELKKKLERLNTAARFIYSYRGTDRAELQRQIKEHPERALDALYSANTLLLLMRSEFFDCCDLADDLVESLEHGTKCVMIPEPEPMPTGAESAPTAERGRNS